MLIQIGVKQCFNIFIRQDSLRALLIQIGVKHIDILTHCGGGLRALLIQIGVKLDRFNVYD